MENTPTPEQVKAWAKSQGDPKLEEFYNELLDLETKYANLPQEARDRYFENHWEALGLIIKKVEKHQRTNYPELI